MEKNESTKADEKSKKRTLSDHENGDISTSRRPKRAAACTNLKEKTIRIPRKSTTIEPKKLHIAEDEVTALHLTAMPSNDPIQTRRLTNFILHDTNGVSQPMEMLEINNIFISGVILPLDEYCSDKEKAKGIKCESFGRVESWNIAGYDEGSPVIWISTNLADYDCLKPAATYKKIFDYFFDKASVSIAVYKKLSKSSPGGDPNTSLEELLATVVRSMSGRSKLLSSNAAIEDFVISQGQFVYNQLSGLDKTAKKHDTSFAESHVLVTLRDMSVMKMKGNTSHHGSLKIHEAASESKVMAYDGGDEDLKYAKIIQDEEYRKSMKTPTRNNKNTASNNKYYIKINEDEIANDYPLPCYYKNSQEEADELLFSESNYEVTNPEDLPRRILQNWTLYNIDSRLISLELLPMKPCADIDVTIYGSGFVTEVKDDDDERWAPLGESEASKQGYEGMAINLSQVKEWMIEYGSSMISISLRTDVAWYRLEKPSKEYAPWHEQVLKTARIAISIIGMLEEQTRLAKLSFANIIKKLSEFEKNDEAYISSNPLSVERYVVVHGQIILQIFANYPNNGIRKCPFIMSLGDKMLEMHHTKWTIKKKKISQRMNLNPMKGMAPMVSKKRVMQATTTLLINRIWGADFYNYAEDGSLQVTGPEIEVVEVEGEAGNEEEDDEEEEEEDDEVDIATESANTPKKLRGGGSEKMEIKWLGEIVGATPAGEPLYRQAFLGEQVVAVGGAVMVEADGQDDVAAIYFVEYMFESSDHSKMLHGRLLQRGSETVLGDSANEGELFMTNECMTLKLKDIQGTVGFEFRSRPWGYQYKKENAIADKLDRERAEERKAKGLPIEYYCRSMYLPERGGFFRLSQSEIGLGSGLCDSCKNREEQKDRLKIKVNENKTGFSSDGVDYYLGDYVYLIPTYTKSKTFRSGPNIGLKAFVVCQILEIMAMKTSRKGSFTAKVRIFYRPEDVSAEKGYSSDMQELYYSEDVCIVPLQGFKGKCQVRSKIDMPLRGRGYPLSEHIFFCEHFYDSSKGSLYQLPANIESKFSTIKDDMLLRKKKGKGLESTEAADELPKEMRLATLDVFAGCGGLSYGLEQAGVCETKWAIEYDEQAGQAFRQNHPESTVFINNCNVILRAMMEKCGDQDDCISTKEADEFAAKLDDKEKRNLPIPGQVDFINGGPPCQGFSELNKYKDRFWSKVQCQMILAFLSFADYFRPKYFLLENVKSFVRNTKTFQLTLASLLEMGYQVRFGILEAGAYGVSQSRKRFIIWAASPEEIIPEWPEPMHVFYAATQKISLSKGLRYAAAPSTKFGAPFRSITVRDTIGDLPPVVNGESNTQTEYLADPVSWFQKGIRGNMTVLTDQICKPMSELNLIRCKRIPKRPGADWRDLPDEKVRLSHGELVDLVPMCLPNKAKTHNDYKGLYGRLDWEGNFPTSITDPQPMGKVGLCFHPDQDRMVTVRECARSQGFPDSFEFSGRITNKHRQIGNAVPPPLAFALGRKLKEAIQLKRSLQDQD